MAWICDAVTSVLSSAWSKLSAAEGHKSRQQYEQPDGVDLPAVPADDEAALDSVTLAPRPTTLRIFHINDVYVLENFPAFKSCVDAMSVGQPNVLKVCAGDFLAPSVLSSLDSGAGVVRVMNACGFDAVCFGNHESDVPNSELFARINELHATWLNSNMRSFTEAFAGKELQPDKCPDMRLVQVNPCCW